MSNCNHDNTTLVDGGWVGGVKCLDCGAVVGLTDLVMQYTPAAKEWKRRREKQLELPLGGAENEANSNE